MSGEATVVEAVQEGSRWLDAKPAGDDFAKWFIDNVRMHKEMDPALYLPGIILIPQNEKTKVREVAPNGRTIEKDVYRKTFTPYAKVDTRLAYFWDLCERRDWVGEIDKVVPSGATTQLGGTVLPEGFYAIPYPKPEGSYGVQLCCSAQVRIYRRDGRGETDRKSPVMLPPAATKVVKFDPDPNTPLKCETGAIGRALGMAGMLVIPGSGVSTAEDMQEVVGMTQTAAEVQVPDVAAPAAEEAAPAQTTDQRLQELWEGLDEAQRDKVTTWAAERQINIAEPTQVQKRPLLAQLEKVSTE